MPCLQFLIFEKCYSTLNFVKMASSSKKRKQTSNSDLDSQTVLMTDRDSGEEDLELGENGLDDRSIDSEEYEGDSEEDMPLANLQGNRQRARPRQSLTTLTVSTSTAGPSSSASTSVTTLSGTIDSGGSGITGTAAQFRDAGIEISDSSDDSDADVPLAQFVVPQLQPATAQVAPQLPPAAAPPVANPVAPQAGAQAQQNPNPIFTWCRSDTFTPKDIPLTANESINIPIPGDGTPYDYFSMYLTDQIFDSMVEETNRFAAQYIASTDLRDKSNAKNWQPTDAAEMRVFWGLLLLMGIVHKPRINMYWAKDDLYYTPIFSQMMSRDRFLLILRFLHFANNDNFDVNDLNRDRLYKIRAFSDMIKERCKVVYTPGKDICVDESLILFKGRLSFKQYI